MADANAMNDEERIYRDAKKSIRCRSRRKSVTDDPRREEVDMVLIMDGKIIWGYHNLSGKYLCLTLGQTTEDAGPGRFFEVFIPIDTVKALAALA